MNFLSLLSEETPDLVRHCVSSYMSKNPGSDTNQAFAICVSTMQKAGYVEPGSMKLTGAGKTREKEHESEPDAGKKMARYEKFLKAAREEAEQKEAQAAMTEQERQREALNEGLVSQIFANIKSRFAAYQSNKEIKVLLTKLQDSLDGMIKIVDRVKALSAKAGTPMDIRVQTTPFGFELTVSRDVKPVSHTTLIPATVEPYQETFAPREGPVRVEEMEPELRELLTEGAGRPALPVGSVRFWKKEGEKIAMVKVSQPDVWVYKKRRHSEAPSLRGRSASVGTVRGWKRRRVVKTGGGWVGWNKKFSQDMLPVQESVAPKRDKMRARVMEAHPTPSQEETQGPKRNSMRARLMGKEKTHG